MNNNSPSFDEKLADRKIDILLHVHQIQHEQSLGHRQSILTAFSLAFAGLLALLAGILAAQPPNPNEKPLLVSTFFIAWLIVTYYIGTQRHSSEQAFKIIRNIEKTLEFDQKDRYLSGESLLPKDYVTPCKTDAVTTSEPKKKFVTGNCRSDSTPSKCGVGCT